MSNKVGGFCHRFVLLFCICFVLRASAIAEDATVTFYTHAVKLYGYPGAKHGLYYGGIYDHGLMLFSFREGFFIKNNRFVTLKMPPGSHTFVASYGKDPSKSLQLPIVLEEGKSYFIRAQSESMGIVIVETERGRLDQVTCNIAHEEAKDAKPLSGKSFSKAIVTSVIPATTLPACP